MKSLVTSFFCLVTSFAVNAAAISTGNALPEFAIADKGELIMAGDEFSWQPWSSSSTSGKVQVIQYLAARQSTNDMNKPFTDALKTRNFPNDKLVSISVVNSDDAMWGTSGLVPRELKKNKKQMPNEVMVIDAKGDGIKTWSLKKESSAIIVLDKQGKVVFFKDGALTADEIKTTIQLVEGLL